MFPRGGLERGQVILELPEEVLRVHVCWTFCVRGRPLRRSLRTWFARRTALVARSWQNGSMRPVLKHGPRSLTCVQVCEAYPCKRSESRSWDIGTNDRPRSSERGLSRSMPVRTRKMVNYACAGWSQGKLWWRLVAILTCKSFVKLGYRGERLIELSSSWFPPKFPSG